MPWGRAGAAFRGAPEIKKKRPRVRRPSSRSHAATRSTPHPLPDARSMHPRTHPPWTRTEDGFWPLGVVVGRGRRKGESESGAFLRTRPLLSHFFVFPRHAEPAGGVNAPPPDPWQPSWGVCMPVTAIALRRCARLASLARRTPATSLPGRGPRACPTSNLAGWPRPPLTLHRHTRAMASSASPPGVTTTVTPYL